MCSIVPKLIATRGMESMISTQGITMTAIRISSWSFKGLGHMQETSTGYYSDEYADLVSI
jgi:hypothetical protein